MIAFQLRSASEQVAAHLREEVRRGTWRGLLPGVKLLATQLGVNHKTVQAALEQLEQEEVLVNEGPRRRRRIAREWADGGKRPLRLAILCFGDGDRREDHIKEIRHRLIEAGHSPFFASRTLEDLEFSQKRVAAFVSEGAADAWLVVAGSREVLAWFGEQDFPVMALFGRWGQARVAGVGPRKAPAYEEMVARLSALGHRRIVMLARSQRILPVPGIPEQAFLGALEANGIPVSPAYNLPVWENTRVGFHRQLETLYQVTPPTALVVQEPVLFTAAQQFLARRGLRVPEDVSLVCSDADPIFEWQVPSVAHIRSDSAPWVRHVLRWAARVSSGRPYYRQLVNPAEFVPGGTMGMAGS